MSVITFRCHQSAIDRLQKWSSETGINITDWELDPATPADRNDFPADIVELGVHNFEAVRMLASEGWLVEGASVEDDTRILFATSDTQKLVQVEMDKALLASITGMGMNNLTA